MSDSTWLTRDTADPLLPTVLAQSTGTSVPYYLTLPYLALPYGEGVLPPSAEAFSVPNAN